MRLQFITETAFWPPLQGDSARLFAMIRYFRAIGASIHVTHLHDRTQLHADYPGMAARVDSLTIYRPSDRDLTARVNGAMDAWCPQGLVELAVEDCRRFGAEVAIAQFAFLSRCLPALASAGVRLSVLDADNVFTQRAALWREAGIPYSWASCTDVEECESLARADLVLAIQSDEAQYFRRLRPSSDVIVVPHAVDVAHPLSTPVSRTVLFIGANNLENAFGLSCFLKCSWPQVRQSISDAELLVAGGVARNASAMEAGVRVVGHVDDPKTLYAAATVVINPCPVGTGLKIKSVEALAYGRPLVTTAFGAQGLVDAETDFVIVRSIDAFDQPLIELLEDPERAAQLGAGAFSFAQKRYVPEAAFGPLAGRLCALLRTRA